MLKSGGRSLGTVEICVCVVSSHSVTRVTQGRLALRKACGTAYLTHRPISRPHFTVHLTRPVVFALAQTREGETFIPISFLSLLGGFIRWGDGFCFPRHPHPSRSLVPSVSNIGKINLDKSSLQIKLYPARDRCLFFVLSSATFCFATCLCHLLCVCFPTHTGTYVG